MGKLYLGMKEEEVPSLLRKSENLRGGKRKGSDVWLFYINGKDDITVAVWDETVRNAKSIIRGNLMSLEVMLYDILGYDDFFAIFKDALPYGL